MSELSRINNAIIKEEKHPQGKNKVQTTTKKYLKDGGQGQITPHRARFNCLNWNTID